MVCAALRAGDAEDGTGPSAFLLLERIGINPIAATAAMALMSRINPLDSRLDAFPAQHLLNFIPLPQTQGSFLPMAIGPPDRRDDMVYKHEGPSMIPDALRITFLAVLATTILIVPATVSAQVAVTRSPGGIMQVSGDGKTDSFVVANGGEAAVSVTVTRSAAW